VLSTQSRFFLATQLNAGPPLNTRGEPINTEARANVAVLRIPDLDRTTREGLESADSVAKSQNAARPISRKLAKRAVIADRCSFHAVTEVACEFVAR
jgi:hypothetical protein